MNSPLDCYTEDAGYAYAEGYDEGYKCAKKEQFFVYTIHAYWGKYVDARDAIVYATTDLEDSIEMYDCLVAKEKERRETSLRNIYGEETHYSIKQIKVNNTFNFQTEQTLDYYKTKEFLEKTIK